jgi:hypothetical protein
VSAEERLRASSVPGAPTNLRTEVLGDGDANCLEKAVTGARAHHELVFMDDLRGAADDNGAGHVLVRDPASGRVWDPNDGAPPANPRAWPHRSAEAWASGQGLRRDGPVYREAGAAPAGEVREALALPPEARAARLVASPALAPLADRLVADGPGDPDLPNGAAAGFGLPRATNVIDGTHGTAPETALRILETMADGRPPFRPDLGLGGVQWHVTGGDPYVGQTSGRGAVLPVEIEVPRGAPTFREQDLLQIFDAELPAAQARAEAQLRDRQGLGPNDPLNRRARNTVTRNAERLAERKMWERVGQRVAASDAGVGQVFLENSRFSKQGNGTFTLTARPQDVRIRGGAQTLVDTLRRTGQEVDDDLARAAQQLARQQGWAGRLQGAVRVGGRVLLIVGAAADGYRIYSAEDRLRETAKVAGGWAGATAAGGAFASWASPSLATGPWGWVGYGLGTLGAGAVGYFAGEAVAEEGYELVVDGDPIFIGPGD